MSSDVQLNPGPSDIDTVLSDVQASENKVLNDTLSLSDTVFGLQCQFNLLCQYCKVKKLRVNISKTKVFVFKKRNNGGQRLEVVNYFIHLGMTLSMQLSLNRMAIDQATKAKQVLISLLNSLYNLGQLPKEFFFIFDRKVSPGLLYGSERWVLQKERQLMQCIDMHASVICVLD